MRRPLPGGIRSVDEGGGGRHARRHSVAEFRGGPSHGGPPFCFVPSADGHLRWPGLSEVHLKEASKNQEERQWRRDNEHLDAAAGVEAFCERCVANGVTIIKPLAATPWGTKDFCIEDPDGYIISFGGSPAAG